MTGPGDTDVSDPLHTPGPLTGSFGTINGAEAFGGVVATPLGWTFWATHGEVGMRRAFVDLDLLDRERLDPPTDPNLRIINPFYGRPASNLAVLRPASDRAWGMSGEAFDEAYLAGVRGSSSRRRVPTARKIRFVVFGIRGRVAIPRWRRQVHAWWRESVRPGSTSSVDEARATYREATQYLERVLRSHIQVSWVGQSFWERLKARCAVAGLTGLDKELVSSDEGFEEQPLIEDLWAVSRDQKSLEDFLAVWGFHGHAEGELSSRVWREDPSPLEPIIRAYRAKPDTENPSALKHRQRDALRRADRQLLEGRSSGDRLRVRFLIRGARTLIPLRQTGRGTFLMAFDVARCMARRIGRQWAADGTLSDPGDVFYLTESELLGELPDDVDAVIRFRRERREHYQTFELPERWTGELTDDMLVPVVPDGGGASRPVHTSERIDGIGVSPGVVEGRAVVVRRPAEAYDLEPGDILVCVTTDPSWAALFYAVSGVVTDIGAEMSHGAIVSRELGLPAVVNTRGASNQLRTGDRIRVDGTNGVVEVLERAVETSPAGSA